MNSSAQPPPKPQRNFPNNSVPQPADIIMIQGLQARSAGQPIVSPSPNTNESQSIVGPYNRPLPDRPYSVAGHYPNMDRTGARFQFAPPANTGEFSGYLSSPEHRPIPTNATLMSIQTGQLRASFAGPYPSTRLFDPNLAGGGGGGVSAAATVSAAIVPNNPNTYVARHPTVATNVIDDEARVRMQEMERKIASLTNVVSKALTTGGMLQYAKYLDRFYSIDFLFISKDLNLHRHQNQHHWLVIVMIKIIITTIICQQIIFRNLDKYVEKLVIYVVKYDN